MGREWIAVIDFGSQYTQLICRRVRELGVYCEIVSWPTEAEAIVKRQPSGLILSGGPASVFEPKAPMIDPAIWQQDRPILGICYGMQLVAQQFGGQVAPSTSHDGQAEYGLAYLSLAQPCPLLNGLIDQTVWMSHGDNVVKVPAEFDVVARSGQSVAAIAHQTRPIYGLQFHPEVHHTRLGKLMLQRFVRTICGCHDTWTIGDFTVDSINDIRATVGLSPVICGLSGGVDSTTTAVLLHQAIGDQLTAIFVDQGTLRLGEAQLVLETLRRNFNLPVIFKDASATFLRSLRGVRHPEQKRRIVGRTFVKIFERVAMQLPIAPRFFAQGTLYPDVIESASRQQQKSAHTIKTHHNVGGLPRRMGWQLVEPFRYLFKDEVRQIAQSLGIPDEIVWRQPFPGPGLAIRIQGSVTPKKLAILRQADAIFAQVVEDYIDRRLLATSTLWQYFAVLADGRTTGVKGDRRVYGSTIVLRAVVSEDGMTADWAPLPDGLMREASRRITNEIKEVNRVVYDVTTKPPATIEWE